MDDTPGDLIEAREAFSEIYRYLKTRSAITDADSYILQQRLTDQASKVMQSSILAGRLTPYRGKKLPGGSLSADAPLPAWLFADHVDFVEAATNSTLIVNPLLPDDVYELNGLFWILSRREVETFLSANPDALNAPSPPGAYGVIGRPPFIQSRDLDAHTSLLGALSWIAFELNLDGVRLWTALHYNLLAEGNSSRAKRLLEQAFRIVIEKARGSKLELVGRFHDNSVRPADTRTITHNELADFTFLEASSGKLARGYLDETIWPTGGTIKRDGEIVWPDSADGKREDWAWSSRTSYFSNIQINRDHLFAAFGRERGTLLNDYPAFAAVTSADVPSLSADRDSVPIAGEVPDDPRQEGRGRNKPAWYPLLEKHWKSYWSQCERAIENSRPLPVRPTNQTLLKALLKESPECGAKLSAVKYHSRALRTTG